MRRLIAVACVALLAAPGLWWRSPVPPPVPYDENWRLLLQPLEVGAARAGEAVVVGAWVIPPAYPGFGSFSTLDALGAGRVRAVSDTGHMLTFSLPGSGAPRAEEALFAGRSASNKFAVDIEAVTRDPASGRIWAAYEGDNAIERFEGDFGAPRQVHPAAMRGWPGNSGAESMVRLADGRFLVISESRTNLFGTTFPALLFPDDPAEGAVPVRFRFGAERWFRPVEARQLPDGRILVLLRAIDLLPLGFNARIVVADPAHIRPGEVWRGRTIAEIDSPLPTDNYEGMVVLPAGDGAVDIWLISDDNNSSLQRTLLMKLRWPSGSRARPPAPNRPG